MAYSAKTTAWKGAKHLLTIGGAAMLVAALGFLTDAEALKAALPPEWVFVVPFVSSAAIMFSNWRKNAGK